MGWVLASCSDRFGPERWSDAAHGNIKMSGRGLSWGCIDPGLITSYLTRLHDKHCNGYLGPDEPRAIKNVSVICFILLIRNICRIYGALSKPPSKRCA